MIAPVAVGGTVAKVRNPLPPLQHLRLRLPLLDDRAEAGDRGQCRQVGLAATNRFNRTAAGVHATVLVTLKSRSPIVA